MENTQHEDKKHDNHGDEKYTACLIVISRTVNSESVENVTETVGRNEFLLSGIAMISEGLANDLTL
jgi:hypothetical protein